MIDVVNPKNKRRRQKEREANWQKNDLHFLLTWETFDMMNEINLSRGSNFKRLLHSGVSAYCHEALCLPPSPGLELRLTRWSDTTPNGVRELSLSPEHWMAALTMKAWAKPGAKQAFYDPMFVTIAFYCTVVELVIFFVLWRKKFFLSLCLFLFMLSSRIYESH